MQMIKKNSIQEKTMLELGLNPADVGKVWGVRTFWHSNSVREVQVERLGADGKPLSGAAQECYIARWKRGKCEFI